MTILPKKKVAKERLEDRTNSNRGHGSLHPSPNPLVVPGAAQYSLLSEGSSTSQNSPIGENATGHVAGPQRSNGAHRLSGPSSPSTSQILTHLNRNKKQKVFSDDEDNEESDGSLENSREAQASGLNLSQRPSAEDDTCNSDDEQSGHQGLSAEEWAQKEGAFARLLKDKRGFIIKLMKEDGACLFRSVADQVMGDQEMHDMVRQQCMDYMARNEDYFAQYITEDFQRYISRKRSLNAHGNHVEIQAMSEVYNRRIEVFQYDSDPINVFQGGVPNENPPIRVSYHMKSHYNSVIDPYAATIGVGLGLPNLQPGLAENGLIEQAVGQSEQDVIEKQMLEDKMLATDWEATDDAIEQQIAQDSYLEWLRQNDKPRSSTDRDNDAPSTSAMKIRTPEGSKPGSPKIPESPNKGHILTQMNNLPPAMFGISDWEEEDGDLLAQVLAASQAEYLESLKASRKE